MLRLLTGTALAATALTAPAAPGAAAAPDPAPGRTVSLTWDGTGPLAVQEPFVGTPAVAPGDHVVSTLTIRNDGPGPGVLRASVARVELRGAGGGPADAFFDELRLEWRSGSQLGSATVRELAGADATSIALERLPRGGTARIEVAYTLPATATSLPASWGSRSVSFVLQLQIAGEVGGAAVPGLPPVLSAARPPFGGSPVPVERAGPLVVGPWFSPEMVAWEALPVPGDRALARTGVQVVRVGLAGVVLLGVGGLLVGAVRRRRDVPRAVPVRDVPHPG